MTWKQFALGGFISAATGFGVMSLALEHHLAVAEQLDTYSRWPGWERAGWRIGSVILFPMYRSLSVLGDAAFFVTALLYSGLCFSAYWWIKRTR